MRRNTPDWFKTRSYPHFDWEIGRQAATNIVSNPTAVTRHAFMPFLTFDMKQPRYKPERHCVEIKPRPIAIASHTDAHIFSYYSSLLALKYESLLEQEGIGGSVLAYRRFTPPKCNIHFAGEAFDAIRSRDNPVAIAVDIEHFFESIDHSHLKQMWCTVLGESRLPDDHYAVYKAITRYAKVDREEAFETLGIGQRPRRTWNRALCTPSEFRQKIRGRGLISVHSERKGIPQGSPISALLSNLYMLDLDRSMHRFAKSNESIYLRYSDDVLLIANRNTADDMYARLRDSVQKLKLDVNDQKTARSDFERNATGLLHARRPLQYLGFTFDGERILVRSQTLAKYSRRMKCGVASARRAAVRASKHGGSRRLRRQELFSRFSHLGPRKNRDRGKRDQTLRNTFWAYTRRATHILGSPNIRRQLRGHWSRLNSEIKEADS